MTKRTNCFLRVILFSLFCQAFVSAVIPQQEKTNCFASVAGSVAYNLDRFYPVTGVMLTLILFLLSKQSEKMIKKDEHREDLTNEKYEHLMPVVKKILGEQRAKKVSLIFGGTSYAPAYTGSSKKDDFDCDIVLYTEFLEKHLGLSAQALQFIVGHETVHVKNKDIERVPFYMFFTPVFAQVLFSGGEYFYGKLIDQGDEKNVSIWAHLGKLGVKTLLTAFFIGKLSRFIEKRADVGAAKALGTVKGGIECFEKFAIFEKTESKRFDEWFAAWWKSKSALKRFLLVLIYYPSYYPAKFIAWLLRSHPSLKGRIAYLEKLEKELNPENFAQVRAS